MADGIIIGLLGICLVGLFVVSFFLYRINSFFRILSKDVKRGNLKEVIDKVIKVEIKNKNEIKRLEKDLSEVKHDILFHVQKVGLVRFNPFNEVGGEHSFSLALLDGNNTGIILTGLHTRERTRVYTKEIKDGKSSQDLSKEEQKALKSTLKI